MLPINPKQNCTPTSSKCVIWQGPDITCINLCKGDSIDEVVYKLALLLCEISENVVDITSLELDCIIPEGDPDPTNLAALLQAMIVKTCALEDAIVAGGGELPEPTLYRLPECLRYTNIDDDYIEYLPLDEYTLLVANRVCTIVSNITTLSNTIFGLEVRIAALEEATPPEPVIDVNITTTCVGTPGEHSAQEAFADLEGEFCELRTVTGTPEDLSAAILKECEGLAADDRLCAEGTMSTISGWVTTPTTVADTINNLWLTICDLRCQVKALTVLTKVDCTDFILSFTGTYNAERTQLALNLSTTVIPSGFDYCDSGWSVTVSDGNSQFTTTISDPALLITGGGTLVLNTFANGISNTKAITIVLSGCVTDSETECNKTSIVMIPEQTVGPVVYYSGEWIFENSDGASGGIDAGTIGSIRINGTLLGNFTSGTMPVALAGSTEAYPPANTTTGGGIVYGSTTVIEVGFDWMSDVAGMEYRVDIYKNGVALSLGNIVAYGTPSVSYSFTSIASTDNITIIFIGESIL